MEYHLFGKVGDRCDRVIVSRRMWLAKTCL